MIEPQSRKTATMWDKSDDPLWLLTPEEFESLPDGIVLTSINGAQKTKDVDYIDQDTRYGYIAWGLKESQIRKNIVLL